MGRMVLALIVVEAKCHYCTRTNDESGEQEEKECRWIGVCAYRAPVEEEDPAYNRIHDTG